MSGRFKPGDGDWICGDPKCGNVNFSRRTSCNKCGKDKATGMEYKKGGSEIGKELAEKSKGLFSADDWQCKTCGNVNWARRSTCNICNAPKVGKIEPRTGLGGGFMERDEVVEYKERTDDDDEYDEFGRKKKKRGTGSQPGESGARKSTEDDENSRDRGADDEEEEEEEDDDEGDASKYKLESDEDDDDEDGGDLSKYNLSDDDSKSKDGPSKSESPTKRNRSRSRSRSPGHKKSRRSGSHASSDGDD